MEREKGFGEKMGQTRHWAHCLSTTNPFNTPFLLSLPCPSPIHPVFSTFPPSPTHPTTSSVQSHGPSSGRSQNKEHSLHL